MPDRNEKLSVTFWSLVLNLVLGLIKCVVGNLAHSRALIVDGLHSLLDLSTDLAVIYGLKMSAKPQDAEHPYGHHKFASLANLFIAVSLVVSCLFLIRNGIVDFRNESTRLPEVAALVTAIVSLGIKEILFFWTRHVAKKEQSRLLLTNAWHHRTDSLSSLGVALAILATILFGEDWAFLDSLAAVALGIFLLWEGAKLLRKACNDLLDTAPEHMIINDIREHILPTPGAIAYHEFRARRVGDMIEVDLHLQVEPTLSVEAGHMIAKAVRKNILQRHPEVLDVLIHLEPATDPHLKSQGVFDFSTSIESGTGAGDSKDK